MSLDHKDVEFDYFTEGSELFTKDFITHVATNVPLFALHDELLYLMQQQKRTSFKIPSYKSLDGRDHTFYFELNELKENKRIKVYRYLGMDIKSTNLEK